MAEERIEQQPFAYVANNAAGRDIVTTVNTITPPRRLTSEEIQTTIKHWPLPKLTDHFIGRKSLLDQLVSRLNAKDKIQKSLVITAHGLGGIGKTQLALKYIDEHKQDYQFVLWFSAESDDGLYLEYYNFAKSIDLPIDNQPPENIIKRVQSWLQENTGWLIVYDNASDAELVAKYRPQSGGNILITSRKDAWNKKQSINIDVFNLDESRAYIIEVTEFTLEEHKTDIDQLATTLGHLPLALAQACAYIVTNKITLQTYLKLYEENKTEMLKDETLPVEVLAEVKKEKDLNKEMQHGPVAVTWRITFKAIAQQQPAALQLLESCTFLHADYIPEFLLKELFNKQQAELVNQLKPFIDAMGCLQQYSMLKQNNEKGEKKFSIHRLVQDVMVDSLSAEKKQSFLLKVIEALQTLYPYKMYPQLEDYTLQRNLLPHLEKSLSRVNEWLTEITNSNSAGESDADLLQYIEKELLLKLLILVANGHGNLGDARKQKDLLELTLPIFEMHYGAEHSDVAITIMNLGNAYGSLGDVRKKKDLLEHALRIQEAYYGAAPHPEVARTLTHLGVAYGDLGDARKQKDLLERALPIFEKLYGAEHPAVAQTLTNLGNAYGLLGDARKRKELLERALPIFKAHYGAAHPEVAITLGNLGIAYGDLGDAGKQKELLERALPIFEKHYGAAHPKVAKTLMHLGAAYGDLGDARKQKDLLKRALRIQEAHYGLDHPEAAISLVELGNAYNSLGDAHKQKDFLECALPILEKHYGVAHPEVARALGSLGNAYGSLGDARKRKELLERALHIFEKHYGDAHPEVAITLINLGNAYGSLGDAAKAKKLLERAYQKLLTHPNAGPQHPHTQTAKKKLDVINQILSNQMAQSSLSSSSTEEQDLDAATMADKEKQLRNLAAQNKVELLSQLIKEVKNLNINAQDNGQHQRSALHWAVLKEAEDCIKLLLKAGADIHLKDKSGKSPLDYGLESKQIKVLGLLLSHKYQVTLEEEIDYGKLLRRTAYEGDVKILGLILEKLPHIVNVKDNGKTERSALHWAVIKGHVECVRILLEAGADAAIQDKEKKLAIDYAKQSNNTETQELLLKFEALKTIGSTSSSSSSSSTTFFHQPSNQAQLAQEKSINTPKPTSWM